MTLERAEQIKNISEEVNQFINELTDKYENIDIPLVQINIENHSNEEIEGKETILKILVNDCKHNSHSAREEYFDNDYYRINVNEREQKNSENVPESNKISDNESYGYENKDVTDNNGAIKNTSLENINTKASETKNEAKSLENQKGAKKTDDSNTKENVDSKLTINYNFNGKYDKTNLYITTPNANSKISQPATGRNYEQLYNELYQALLGFIKNNRLLKKNANNASPLQRFFDTPKGIDFFSHQPNENDESQQEIDALWNVMMETLKTDNKSPKNCVYALKKTCEGANENN